MVASSTYTGRRRRRRRQESIRFESADLAYTLHTYIPILPTYSHASNVGAFSAQGRSGGYLYLRNNTSAGAGGARADDGGTPSSVCRLSASTTQTDFSSSEVLEAVGCLRTNGQRSVGSPGRKISTVALAPRSNQLKVPHACLFCD